jgi:hypothetical protein
MNVGLPYGLLSLFSFFIARPISLVGVFAEWPGCRASNGRKPVILKYGWQRRRMREYEMVGSA